MAVNRTADHASVRGLGVVQAPAWAAPLVLGALMLVAYIARLWLNGRVAAPWIMADELTHSEMAKSFADGEGLEVRGFPSYARTLYPALIAPAWLASSVETAFTLAKAINAALMTLTCIPVYLWARRLVSSPWAIAAGALVLVLPAFAYTGTIMTESAALPAFLLALWVFARVLETPTLLWQIAAVGAALAATAIRLQAVVLFAVLATAIVIDAVTGGWGRSVRARLRPFVPIGFAVLAIVAVVLAYSVVSGGGLREVFGGYRSVLELDYSLSDGLRWTVMHAAELSFAVGVVPVAAFVVLAGLWLRRGTLPAERAFVAVAGAAVVWILPQAGFFASRYSQRIEERNMLYLEPLLLLALAVWSGRGAPRPARLAAVAAALPLALLVAIPLERLFGVALLAATFGLIPLLRLSTLLDGGADTVRALLAVGGVAAGLLFVLVPRRFAAAAIGVVGVFLALSSWSVAGTLRDQANATRREPQTSNVNWIDERVGEDADVPIIFTNDLVANSHPVWQTEFWNRSVGDVYGLNAEDPTSLPTVATAIDERGRIVRSDGRVLSPRYVLAEPGLDIAGDEVASEGRFVLYRVAAPLRLETQSEGLYGDGWTGPSATYTNFSDRFRTVRVDVGRGGWSGPDVPGRVTIVVERADTGRRVSSTRWEVHSGAQRSFRLRVPPAPFRVKVDVHPTFSPAAYGSPDSRQLGVQLAIAPS